MFCDVFFSFIMQYMKVHLKKEVCVARLKVIVLLLLFLLLSQSTYVILFLDLIWTHQQSWGTQWAHWLIASLTIGQLKW